ncbi:hypothetical protein ACH429_11950 [Streptomyces pathocidini]|uniref:Cellulose synthase n=1 Tax=Streptomyces pathocidini TaxID=1650571 RepID=A0ABW7USW8_9ACTN|nr:hypothetical protein [Streptomyces pathocidini]
MLTTTVCVALSAAGLAIAILTAYRRRYLRATRIAAFALIPVGLAMAGLATLGGRIGRAVGDWAADLVFRPTVWAGFAVLALSVVLFTMTRLVGRRTRTSREAPAAESRPAVAPTASAPSLGPGRKREEPKRKAGKSDGLEDFEDIEAILKKHGI